MRKPTLLYPKPCVCTCVNTTYKIYTFFEEFPLFFKFLTFLFIIFERERERERRAKREGDRI